MKITIIGNGVWGKALYSVIQNNTSNVSFAKKDEPIINTDVVVLSLPTQSIRECLNYLPSKKNLIIINTAKGIEKQTHLLPHQIIRSILGDEIDYFTLIGPSFAQEVSLKMPTVINLGFSKKSKNTKKIKNLFETNYFSVKETTEIEILEISAAFKNIYAILCGVADGLGYQANTRVRLILAAFEEEQQLFKSLHLKSSNSSFVGTVGDLILSCNSVESRNFKFGKLLTNYPANQALKKVNSTVEGYHSLVSVSYFEKLAHTKLILASFVKQIVDLSNPSDIRKKFQNFMKNDSIFSRRNTALNDQARIAYKRTGIFID